MTLAHDVTNPISAAAQNGMPMKKRNDHILTIPATTNTPIITSEATSISMLPMRELRYAPCGTNGCSGDPDCFPDFANALRPCRLTGPVIILADGSLPPLIRFQLKSKPYAGRRVPSGMGVFELLMGTGPCTTGSETQEPRGLSLAGSFVNWAVASFRYRMFSSACATLFMTVLRLKVLGSITNGPMLSRWSN